MKFSDLTKARLQLNSMAEKTAGIIGSMAAAPVKGLWNASKKTGGPFAPLVFGGAALGGVALAKKSVSQAKNYAAGFNPQLQEAVLRSP